MKIGIIGAGYIGQALATHWKNQGHQVVITTRHEKKVPQLKKITDDVFLIGSRPFSDFFSSLEALIICVAPDLFTDYTSTYLTIAKEVSEQIPSHPALKQILYTSSLSVYGDHNGEWIDENTPPTPSSRNGKILLETEKILLQCASPHIKICIFRLGEIYGPNRLIENRLKQTIHQPFSGTGLSYTNLIHQTDVVNALDLALNKRLEGFYNLCSDFHITRKALYDEICKKKSTPFSPMGPFFHQPP